MQNASWAGAFERLHFPDASLSPGSRHPTEVTLKLPSILLLAFAAVALAAPSSFAAAAKAPPAKSPAPAATKGALTLLYGDDHVFGVIPPDGWTVDDTSGLGSKIRVVLYPRGQKWDSSPTVMYVNPIHQDPGHAVTLRQMIDRDVQSFMEQFPQGHVSVEKTLRTSKAQPAEVRYFASTGAAPTEAVAYVEEKSLVMLLVLQSRNPSGFQQSLPAFQSLVSSYQFVAGNVDTPK